MAKTAKKLNVTIREDLLERMDDFASNNGMSRSGLIAIAVTQYLNAIEAMPSVNKLLVAMAEIAGGAANGEITQHEAEVKMAALQLTYDALTKKP